MTLTCGGGGGPGGEGLVHRSLKAAIAANPQETIGELGLTHIRTEFPFPTGDCIDVLLRDRDGRYVAIEIEPDCSEREVCGPLQCMKYRSLLEYTLGRRRGEVRTILVSRTIHPAIRAKCEVFEIETCVVTLEQEASA